MPTGDNIFDPEWLAVQVRQTDPDTYEPYTNKELYDSFRAKYPTPMGQLRALYPEYKPFSDAQFTQALFQKFGDDRSLEQFQRELSPATGFQGAYFSIMDQLPVLARAWPESLGDVAQFPGRVLAAVDRVNRALASDREKKRIAGTQPTPPERIIPQLGEFGTEQEERALEVEPAPEPTTIAGHIGRTVFGTVGAAPSLALSYGPSMIPGGGVAGAGVKLLASLIYEGVTADAKARQENSDKRLVKDGLALSTRVVNEWLFNTPRGRILNGLVFAAANIAENHAQAYFEGKDVPFKEDTASAIVGALTGAIASKTKQYPEAARQIFFDAVEQNRRGNTKAATEQLDRGLMLLTDRQRAELTDALLALRNKAVPEPEELTYPERPPRLPYPEAPKALTYPLAVPRAEQKPFRKQEPLRPLPYDPTKPIIPPRTVIPYQAAPIEFTYRPTTIPADVEAVVKSEVPTQPPLIPLKTPEPMMETPAGPMPEQWVSPTAVTEPVRITDPQQQITLANRISAAYQELSVERGRRSIPIGDVIGKSGLKLEDARAAIVAMPEVQLDEGDWSVSSLAQRQAAIPQRGRVRTLMAIEPPPVLEIPDRSEGERTTLPDDPDPDFQFENYYFGPVINAKMIGDFIETNWPIIRGGFQRIIPFQKEIGEVLAGKGRTVTGEKLRMSWAETFDPREVSEEHELALSIIASEQARSAVWRQRLAQYMIAKMSLLDRYRFAREQARRQNWWEYFPKETLKRWMELSERGKSTGNEVADFLYGINKRVKEELARIANRHGLYHDIRKDYFPHIIKDFPRIRPALERFIARQGWGDPGFVHHRVFDYLTTLHRFGIDPVNGEIVEMLRWNERTKTMVRVAGTEGAKPLELVTYNDEKLTQLAVDARINAIKKAQILKSFARNGLALPKAEFALLPKEVQQQLETQGVWWRSPTRDVDGQPQDYLVAHAGDFLLHRTFDESGITGYLNSFLSFGNAVKQRTVGINLALSGFHHLHMLGIGEAQNISLTVRKALAGQLSAADMWSTLRDLASFGMESHLRAIGYRQDLLDFYQGSVTPGPLASALARVAPGPVARALRLEPRAIDWGDLSPTDQEAYRFQREGGFVPLLSHEREIQFMPWLNKLLVERVSGGMLPAVRQFDNATDIGIRLLSMQEYQAFLFRRVVPSLKMMFYDREVDFLRKTNPELFTPEGEAKRRMALARIARKVDSRFGESFYGALFWPKAIKQFGKTFFLSLTWKLGAWRTYAGAVHDFWHNVVYLDDIARITRQEGWKAGLGKFATENIVYAATLTAASALFNLAVSQFIGTGVNSMMDAIFPNVGLGKDGNPIRVKPPFWLATEIGSLWHLLNEYPSPVPGIPSPEAIGRFTASSANPAIATLYRLFDNHDYRGRQIVDASDNLSERGWKWLNTIFGGAMPFSVEQIFISPKPGQTVRDGVLAVLGLPPAAMWTERSATENAIISSYGKFVRPAERTSEQAAKTDAVNAYRNALMYASHDEAVRYYQRALELGVKKERLAKVPQELKHSFGQSQLARLPEGEQKRILREASPEEFKKYFPFAKKSVQEEMQLQQQTP